MYDNESARSFAWLKSITGYTPGDPNNLLSEAWTENRKIMLSIDQRFTYSQDWVSDFWLSRSADSTSGLSLSPKWDPPEQLDEWAVFGADEIMEAIPKPFLRGNDNRLGNILSGSQVPKEINSQDSVDDFTAMLNGIRIQGDTKMIQKEHVRAWIGTSIGHLLMAVTLSPQDQPVDLLQLTLNRLSMPLQTALPQTWVNDFEDRRLEILYNKRLSTPGRFYPDDVKIRIGQGEEWREHWGWLSRDLAPTDMIEAIRLVASLLRCQPLAVGLLTALNSDNQSMKTMALVVFRRWLLTLKIMTWLEDALAQSWKYIRPQDLACFAFNAVKPDWPHRVVGISHRSGDVKPALIKTSPWSSGLCAIDSNYVPSWETNIGMMWGLFAATPLLCRIRSPHFDQSVWCLREYEMMDYLVNQGDFLKGRGVLDLEMAELGFLDELVKQQLEDHERSLSLSPISFPPLCNVWVSEPMPEWEIKVLRAAALLRIMRFAIADASVTNNIGWRIETGLRPSVPPPTNNPGGWEDYAAIFRDLRAICKTGSGSLDINLPTIYSTEQVTLDTELWQKIPDLATGIPVFGDVLVAFEWLRTEWPLLLEEKYGNFLAIDCRGLSREQWMNDERLSLWRGLASIRTPLPVWFIQNAGQDVESWPLIGDRPIFTEHVPDQFAWMLEIHPDRSFMQLHYPEHSRLEFSKALKRLIREMDFG